MTTEIGYEQYSEPDRSPATPHPPRVALRGIPAPASPTPTLQFPIAPDQRARLPPKIRFEAWIVLGLCAAFVAFFPTLGSGFLSDDFVLISALQQDGPLALWSSAGQFFRPLTSLCLALDHALWGLSPRGYHVSSLLAHAFAALALLFAVRELGLATRLEEALARRLAQTAAALFLVLPSHTEAVVWIAARGDLLATLLVLSSIATYLRYRRTGHRGFLTLSLLAAAGGLTAKESAIALPVLICFMEAALPPPEGERRSRWAAVWAHAALLGVYLAIRWAVLGHPVGGYGAAVHLALGGESLFDKILGFSARSLFPPMTRRSLPGECLQYLVGVLALATAVRWILAHRAGRELPFGALRLTIAAAALAVLAELPVLTLWVSPTMADGERLVYLASAFSVVAVVALLHAATGGGRAFRVSFFALGLLALGSLLHQTSIWQKAAELRHETLEGLGKADGAAWVYLLAIPDNFRGAHIFRNGLPEALEMGSEPPEIRKIISVTTLDLRNPRAVVDVQREGQEIILRVDRRQAELRPPPVQRWVETLEADREHLRIRLRLPSIRKKDRVAVFSDGRLRWLDL